MNKKKVYILLATEAIDEIYKLVEEFLK